MKKIKESKGAATLFVLIVGLFFISFILSILMLASAKRQSQIQIGKHTQEIYNELNQDKINEVKNIVPIYTKEQLLKIGSGEEIAIEKENGKKYVFSPNAYYVLNSDIELEHNGIWDISQYNLDEAGYAIKIKDTSKPDTAYYYYVDKYNYPVTENGFKYEGLVVQYDGTNNTGNGHSNGTTVWKDLSGNGNNGTLMNFSYSSSSGWHTDRLTFDGESSYITLQNNPIYTANENTEYTLNIVVDVNTVKTHTFFCNRTVVGQGISIFLINNIIRCDNGSTQWTTEYELPVNQKINVTIVKNATEIALYVDGQLLKISNEVGNKTSLHEGIFTLGASQIKNPTTGVVERFDNYLNGDIYLVNIYDKALTEQEVKNNYEAEKNRTVDYSEKTKGWNFTKISNIVKEKERIAPIPEGYVASSVSGEDTISGGLVIYQGEDAVTSANHSTAMLNRNQYVWIPVDDINDMVMCKKNGSDKKIDGTATDGGKTTCELEYDVVNDIITCNVHGYNTETALSDDSRSPYFIDKTGLAGRVYDVPTTDSPTKKETTEDNKKIYTLTPSFKEDTTFSANSGYREPAIVTGSGTSYDGVGSNLTRIGITVPDNAKEGTTVQDVFKAQLNSDFIAMAKSVAKYGGFYISRYEPSYENNKVISKKNKKVLTAAASASESDNYLAGDQWYGLYNKTLNSVEKDASVNSHMIWGCQYDQVIKFIGNRAEIGHTYQTPKQEKTGYDRVENGNPVVDQDILNNIYDLEGNNREWTAQAISTDLRVYRGNYYNSANNSNFGPASRRANGYPTYTDDSCTARSTLTVAL